MIEIGYYPYGAKIYSYLASLQLFMENLGNFNAKIDHRLAIYFVTVNEHKW